MLGSDATAGGSGQGGGGCAEEQQQLLHLRYHAQEHRHFTHTGPDRIICKSRKLIIWNA